MSTVTVQVLGLPKVLAMIDPKVIESAAMAGLMDAGHAIEREAKGNVNAHRWRGTLQQNTTTVQDGALSVTVGVHGGMAPEGRPLEYGWASAAGKQPPTEAIAAWLVTKGVSTGLLSSSSHPGAVTGSGKRRGTIAQASGDSAVRGLAFVIARNIGRRGYSFGELHWLKNAYDSVRPKIVDYVGRRIARG